MKVIDLLNKIANGEEVPLIKYRDKISHWNKENDRFEDKDGMNTLYEVDFSELNDEVELIEEDKKIEKINEIEYYHQFGDCWVKDKFYNDQKGILVDEIIIDKINEIIDYRNGGTNGE